MSYEHNIFWSEIPKNAKIYDLGGSWVVHMPDGRKGLVYWTGNDAGKAQDMLKMRALPKERMPKEEPKKAERTSREQKEIDSNMKQFKAEHPEIYGRKHVRSRCKCGAFLANRDRDRPVSSRYTTICKKCNTTYDDGIEMFKKNHPEIYGEKSSCTIICKFPRRK